MFKICQKPIKERTEAETDGIVKYLKKNFSIFENTEKGQLKEIAGKLHPVLYKEETKILREGDMGDFLVILFAGKVKISRTSQNLRTGTKNKMQALL